VAMGGRDFAEYPHQASRDEQIVIAERLLARSGWGQWPACSARLGLR
jgi:resuscitation-promoting factor RpfA